MDLVAMHVVITAMTAILAAAATWDGTLAPDNALGRLFLNLTFVLLGCAAFLALLAAAVLLRQKRRRPLFPTRTPLPTGLRQPQASEG
ncbi:hypothetical protein ACFU51_30500 [Streptomyces sp. NPDC057430]|uniref:hypothetical protein n=1 Tax=unclassified Streptomyces TaxID=2593676 RepID=UPI0036B01FBC